MSKSARFGPVQAHFNDDGTLSIYQPDSNRVLSAATAGELVAWLNDNGSAELIHPGLESDYYAAQSTVGGGVISTSEGAVSLTAAELEQDRNAAEALNQMTAEAHADGFDETVADFGPARDVKPAPRRRGRPPKARS